MCKFETMARSGRDAERVSTAFYRFLELHSDKATAVSMRTEIIGDCEHRDFTFWSDEAAVMFAQFLKTFRLEPPPGLLTPFGADRRPNVPESLRRYG